jgi:hypothetical protein
MQKNPLENPKTAGSVAPRSALTQRHRFPLKRKKSTVPRVITGDGTAFHEPSSRHRAPLPPDPRQEMTISELRSIVTKDVQEAKKRSNKPVRQCEIPKYRKGTEQAIQTLARILNGCANQNQSPTGASAADVDVYMKKKFGVSQQERETYNVMADNLFDKPPVIPPYISYHRGPRDLDPAYIARMEKIVTHAGFTKWLPSFKESPKSIYNQGIINVFMNCFQTGVLHGDLEHMGVFVRDYTDPKFIESLAVSYIWGRMKDIYVGEIKSPGRYALANKKNLGRKNRENVRDFMFE